MQTMHPTLLIGPADWDSDAMPRLEFERRIARLWQDQPQASGAIVFGSPHDHAELAYLTHFTPKLEPGLALIPRNGEPQLLVGGGVNMIAAARPLTWIENLAPLRDVGDVVAAWSADHPAAVLIGGDAMSWRLRGAVDAAMAGDASGGDAGLVDGTAMLRQHMRAKSDHERAAVVKACGALEAAVGALRERASAGGSVTDIVIAAEHAAANAGAQDVRSLFSLDGGRTLRPFEVPLTDTVDSLQVYLAVRCEGYWAEGFVALNDQPFPASRRAYAALKRASEVIKAGVTFGAFERRCIGMIDPLETHPIIHHAVVPMGLALDTPREDDDMISAGDVVSLRIGVTDGEGAAIASAMLAIGEDSAEILWSAV